MSSANDEIERQLNHLASMPGLGHTTMRKRELADALTRTGGQLILFGRLYDITSQHLGAGVYRVSTKLAADEGGERARKALEGRSDGE